MKLSISNIAWSAQDDAEIHSAIQELGFQGLEIAPTRIIPEKPYDHIVAAKEFARVTKSTYGLEICSMQSIWFGISERIFGSQEDRQILIDYTRKAIVFAKEIQCPNLVFGCPKNRIQDIPDLFSPVGMEFFKTISDSAHEQGVVIALEPNPTIYGTNYVNTTQDAISLVTELHHPAFKINVDLGAMLFNNEDFRLIERHIPLVNHIHISEPNLATIQSFEKLKSFKNLILNTDYSGFLSIEMKNPGSVDVVKSTIHNVCGIFHQ